MLGTQVEVLILIGKVVGGFIAVILLMSVPWMLMDLFFTRKAKRVISKFCADHNFQIEKIEVHKNHLGLRFSKNDQKGYVRFRVGKREEIEWVGNVPDVIKQHS